MNISRPLRTLLAAAVGFIGVSASQIGGAEAQAGVGAQKSKPTTGLVLADGSPPPQPCSASIDKRTGRITGYHWENCGIRPRQP